jgi:hypothetical protein
MAIVMKEKIVSCSVVLLIDSAHRKLAIDIRGVSMVHCILGVLSNYHIYFISNQKKEHSGLLKAKSSQ